MNGFVQVFNLYLALLCDPICGRSIMQASRSSPSRNLPV